MMKTKLFFCAFFASLLGLTACSSIPDVKVEDVANNMTPKSFVGTEVRSKTVLDGLSMKVDEWTIVNVENSTIAHTSYAFGDKLSAEMAPVVYSFTRGQVAEHNLGVNYLFTPVAGGEALDVLYWGNSLIFGKDTISDASAPIANMKKIETNFPNRAWLYSKVDYLKHDTIRYEQRDTVKHVGVVDGKKQWIIDTVLVTKKQEIKIDSLGPRNEHYIRFEFKRDADSFENTADKLETFKWFESLDVLAREDSVVESHFHWGLNSITTGTRFALNMRDDKSGETTRISVSGLDVEKKMEVNISNYVYNLITE